MEEDILKMYFKEKMKQINIAKNSIFQNIKYLELFQKMQRVQKKRKSVKLKIKRKILNLLKTI